MWSNNFLKKVIDKNGAIVCKFQKATLNLWLDKWETLFFLHSVKQTILLRWCQQTFENKSLLTTPSNVLPYYLKQTFPLIIWIFTEGEEDGIKSRLPYKTFSTLNLYCLKYISLAKCNKILFNSAWSCIA